MMVHVSQRVTCSLSFIAEDSCRLWMKARRLFTTNTHAVWLACFGFTGCTCQPSFPLPAPPPAAAPSWDPCLRFQCCSHRASHYEHAVLLTLSSGQSTRNLPAAPSSLTFRSAVRHVCVISAHTAAAAVNKGWFKHSALCRCVVEESETLDMTEKADC